MAILFHFLLLTYLLDIGVQCLNSTYTNPILPGFHPDPSCIHVPEWGNTFFCASSSFSVFPGLPIHASKDLQHWKLVSNALNRPEQLPDLAITNKSTSGVWAPALRYHEGTFYILTTLVFDDQPETNNSRWENFIITSKDPFSSASWSDPVHFNFTGYDTSPYWNVDGTTYVTGSHPWEVQPGINQAPIDLATGEIGDIVNVWNGTGGEAPEGPHIYKKDGYYYLMIAEGGTGLNHEEDIARSRNINGPYESNPANPILTNANTSAFFQTVGHADLFQDNYGQWWACALSTRSGPNYTTYPMGRETVLTPVTWNPGEWPIFTNVSGVMNGWHLPPAQIVTGGEGPLINAPDHLDFAPKSTIPPQLVHWRLPIADNYVVSPQHHPYSLQLGSSLLNLTAYDANYAGPQGQTFIGRRQVDTLFKYNVDIDYSQLGEEEQEVGVSLFLVQKYHLDLGIVMLPLSTNDSTLTPHLRFRGIASTPLNTTTIVPIPPSWSKKSITMQIQAINLTHYTFSAGPAGAHPSQLKRIAYGLGSEVSFGFTGTLVGVYATTNGRNGTGSEFKTWVSNWEYVGEGQITE